MRVRHRWGSSFVPAQRLISKDGQHAFMLLDPNLDHSGWTPAPLALLTDLAARLPFEEAALVATNFGLRVSSSDLERLTAPAANAVRDETFERLHEHAQHDPPPPGSPEQGRVWMLELDGVVVLERATEGSCSGIEIKNVTLYPIKSPNRRLVVADVRTAEELYAVVLGLLRLAGVTSNDTLVGLGDGAVWIERIIDTYCDVAITDCFHAASYLEEVMLALGWEDAQRAATRAAWCRGEIDARAWLMEFVPSPEVWLTWSEEAVTALRYLEERVQRMRYPHFRGRGFAIGSGVIEGLNKSVIGSRMKRSGMQWSRSGAARMAALRAWVTTRRPLVAFGDVRQRAYPPPSLLAA